MKKQLEWNVIIREFNSRTIEKYNVFNSLNFYEGLKRIKKEISKKKIDKINPTKEDLEWFNEKVRRCAQYSFWSKVEYEIFVSEPFPCINNKELTRLKELESQKYCANVNLTVGKKINVYDQLELNWDKFVEYIWVNLKLIKMR